MQGRSVEEYRAPLFIAWQLTNRCEARCIACCEESGPDKAWSDELRRDEAQIRSVWSAGYRFERNEKNSLKAKTFGGSRNSPAHHQ